MGKLKKIGIGFGIIIGAFFVVIILSQIWLASLTPEERQQLEDEREAKALQKAIDENAGTKSETIPKTYPPATIGGIPMEPGVSYKVPETTAKQQAELEYAIINDPLYDVIFDPRIVSQAEQSIPVIQDAFRIILDECSSVRSYSDYIVFVAGMTTLQNEINQITSNMHEALTKLELLGYDNHYTIGPLIKETRQLAGAVGDCIIDLQNRYEN